MADNLGGAPRGRGRKIINKQGIVSGYIKGRFIYNTDMTIWGKLPSNKLSNTFVQSDPGDAAIAYFDANENLFDTRGNYLGSLKRRNKAFSITLVVLLMLLLVGVSSYFSTYILGSIGISVFNPKYPTFDLVQSEGNTSWNELEQLDILKGPSGAKVIFPGAIGTYSFIIDNKNESIVTFDINISDINQEKIPMRYRLKMNNVYIVGSNDSWATIADMKKSGIKLPADSRALYTLEWKWDSTVSDEIDTAIGLKATATYTLELAISAEITTIN